MDPKELNGHGFAQKHQAHRKPLNMKALRSIDRTDRDEEIHKEK